MRKPALFMNSPQNLMEARRSTFILVYSGKGSNKESRKLLHHALKSVVDPNQHSVKYVTPRQILEGSWVKTSQLIVFGGGYDLGFESALGREGAKQIRRFVQNGGSYLGICAGAYWACDFIEFDKGGPLEVTGERFLKFYPGFCIGPAFPGFQYNSRIGVQAVPVRYKQTTDFDVYSEGGGFFKPYKISSTNQDVSCVDRSGTERLIASLSELHDTDHTIYDHDGDDLTSRFPVVDTLGTYSSLEKDSTAIVKCRVGNGVAVLSGVHVEFQAHLLNKKDAHLKPLLPKLLRSEDIRMYVFKDILTQLGVKCQEHSKL